MNFIKGKFQSKDKVSVDTKDGKIVIGFTGEIVKYNTTQGALAMTTLGDTTMASLKEVEKIVTGGSARVER